MTEKEKIFYSRSYRRLKVDKFKTSLYFLVIVLPSLVLLLLNISNISSLMSYLGIKVLGKYFPGIPMQIVGSQLTSLIRLEHIELPTVYPSIGFSFLNLLVTLALILFVNSGKRKEKLISIYLTVAMTIHLINCIYFIFAANYFPYSALGYSDLYMKQQLAIWIMFIILTGLLTGFFGGVGFTYKIFTFLGTLSYSLIFGIIRYILFLYIIQKFSILYMAPMFFVFGPFFDFLYLVGIYSIFVNKMVELYDSTRGSGEWIWS